MKVVHIVAIALALACVPARADQNTRYIFAKAGSDGDLEYTIDGSRFREDQLPAYFDGNPSHWPKARVQLRVVFRSDVSLAWFDYGCRSFRVRGFRNVRCFSGSVRTGRAREMKGIGEVVPLPVERW